MIFSNGFSVYTAVLVRKAVDYAAGQRGILLESTVLHRLLLFGMAILGLVLLHGFFLFLMRQTIIVMSRLIEYDLKNEVFEHYQSLDLGFYKRNSTGDLMNRISEDVSHVRMYIGPAVMYLANTVATVIIVIATMTNVDLKLSLYVLVPLPVLALCIYYVSELINRKSVIVQAQQSKLSTLSQESFSGIRVLKAFVREKHFAKKIATESEDYLEKNIGLARVESFFMSFIILLTGLSVLCVIYIGGREAIVGRISPGSLPEFMIYVYKLTWPIASLGWVASLIQRAAASQQRINEFLHRKPAIQNTNLSSGTAIRGKIEFRNVSFVYPDSGIKALDDVSFTIEPGRSLAITGRTGSGKSTIISLICRLYDATDGKLIIDNQDIKSINLNKLRRGIGCVTQDVFLFSDTIANNIGFSLDPYADAKTKKAVVEQAARDAAIYSNIAEFPQQFETMLGERGITLSGGQKQRISIARAIVKNPQILLFDDCLSAVDTETEEVILENLRRIMQGKTTLIASHRISSIKHANHIIVLENGKIAEEGNHLQLLGKKGLYFEIHQKQLLEDKISL